MSCSNTLIWLGKLDRFRSLWQASLSKRHQPHWLDYKSPIRKSENQLLLPSTCPHCRPQRHFRPVAAAEAYASAQGAAEEQFTKHVSPASAPTHAFGADERHGTRHNISQACGIVGAARAVDFGPFIKGCTVQHARTCRGPELLSLDPKHRCKQGLEGQRHLLWLRCMQIANQHGALPTVKGNTREPKVPGCQGQVPPEARLQGSSHARRSAQCQRSCLEDFKGSA